MYSLVLMSAMTTAPAGPEFNGYFRDLFFGCGGGSCYGSCNGCYGSSGGARYNCSGCYGSCHGCDGGFLGFGLLSRRPIFDRGSCNGYAYAPGYGCSGSMSHAPSYGCSGSMSYAPSSGCYGSASYSCYGGVSYAPSSGCYGGSAPFQPGGTLIPGGTVPLIPYAPTEPAPALERSGFTPATYAAAASPAAQGARATVIVKLPADAKLYAEGKLLALTTAERKFVTPPLPDGEFSYRFKIEYDRDGETYSVTKKVPVKAGGTVTVEFADQTSSKGGIKTNVTTTDPAPATAPGAVVPAVVPPVAPAATPSKTERATITVKLPPGAVLYVDDKKSPSSEPVRQFTTPPVPTGKEYVYLMKAEVVRDGRPESITQKVSFKAGDQLTVDFTTAGK